MSQNSEPRNYRRTFICGLLVGVLVALILIGFDIAHFLSRSNIYEQVELNTPQAEALELLRSDEVYCQDAWISHRCTFDDYWRVYTITFSETDPQHTVIRKFIAYKKHKRTVVRRLLSLFYLT